MDSTNVRSGMKSRKKKPKTTVIDDDDDCMTCSACQSKLVKISDITKVSLDYINTMRVIHWPAQHADRRLNFLTILRVKYSI